MQKFNSAPPNWEVEGSAKLAESLRAQISSFKDSHKKDGKFKQSQQVGVTLKWIISYIIYYTCTLLINMVLLAMYVIQVFTDHHTCTTQSGRDITKGYEMAFTYGLVILVADAINTNIINIYLRFTAQTVDSKEGVRPTTTERMLVISTVIEWVMRFGTGAVSLLQFLINHANQTSQCVKKPDGVLVSETKWLTILVTIQLLKIITFSIWSLKLEEPDSQRDSSKQQDESGSTFGKSMQGSPQVRLPKPTIPGSLYNYLQNTEADDDEEELRGLIKEPWTTKVERNRSKEPHSPISPYSAHQNLKRTKTQRKIETKRRNYQKKCSEWSNTNLTLYDKSMASRNIDALLDVHTPSSHSELGMDNIQEELKRMVTPHWQIQQNHYERRRRQDSEQSDNLSAFRDSKMDSKKESKKESIRSISKSKKLALSRNLKINI